MGRYVDLSPNRATWPLLAACLMLSGELMSLLFSLFFGFKLILINTYQGKWARVCHQALSLPWNNTLIHFKETLAPTAKKAKKTSCTKLAAAAVVMSRWRGRICFGCSVPSGRAPPHALNWATGWLVVSVERALSLLHYRYILGCKVSFRTRRRLVLSNNTTGAQLWAWERHLRTVLVFWSCLWGVFGDKAW